MGKKNELKSKWPSLREEEQKLVEENHNLIYFVIRKMGLSVEEFYGDAAIGLCMATLGYDESKGKFSSYAAMAIRNEICKTLRKNRRDLSDEAISLDIEVDDKGIKRIEDQIKGKCEVSLPVIDLSYNIEKSIDRMTDLDIKMICLMLDGCSQSKIAETLGISKQAVNFRIQRIRKWLSGDIEGKRYKRKDQSKGEREVWANQLKDYFEKIGYSINI